MKSFKQYIIESEEKIFGHNYDDLLDTIQDEVEYGEAEDILRGKIEELEKIQKENQINLYRVIFVIDKNNIDKNKLGHHYVPDPEDFHEQMIDYLFQNAKKENQNIKENDLYMVKITTPTSNIDYQYTLMTFVAHPFENEITVKDDAKINIVSIETYYEST